MEEPITITKIVMEDAKANNKRLKVLDIDFTRPMTQQKCLQRTCRYGGLAYLKRGCGCGSTLIRDGK